MLLHNHFKTFISQTPNRPLVLLGIKTLSLPTSNRPPNRNVFGMPTFRGLKIIREADEYYLIHQGVIQRHLGSRKGRRRVNGRTNVGVEGEGEGSLQVEESCFGILDKILFFIGDLEVATRDAKRKRIE